MFQRYVALGDSFSEGVGDPDRGQTGGLRGWADRVAEGLAAQNDRLGYANLAIRGRKLGPILAEQLEPALALRPDLVTLAGGGNDVMRPKVDIPGLIAALDDAVAACQEIGATVVLPTYGHGERWGRYDLLHTRFVVFNRMLRELAERRGAVFVDNWALRLGRDARHWDPDRIHLAGPGHQRVAINVLDTLGIHHHLEPLPLPEAAPVSAWGRRRQTLAWACTQAAPWVHRRLTGRSSGDGVGPKRPTLLPVDPG